MDAEAIPASPNQDALRGPELSESASVSTTERRLNQDEVFRGAELAEPAGDD